MEASDIFVDDYFSTGDDQLLTDTCFFNHKPSDNDNQFAIDDLLLDFPKEEDELTTDAFFNSFPGNSADSSTLTALDSSFSSASGSEPQLSGNISFTNAQFSTSQLCLPYDDELAELEWLSNFVEDDMRNLHYIPAAATSPTDTSSSVETVTNKTTTTIFGADVAVPGKARSKRPRAAPCDWSSRLLHLSASAAPVRKRETSSVIETPGRKCLHCASEKTPQWRTGPLGPKTLCNACGVRYKSGRLVPEYRPAASPTFVSARHSNSHRKVMELRRQKEVRMGVAHDQQHQQFISQTTIFGHDHYLIDHGQQSDHDDFRRMV